MRNLLILLGVVGCYLCNSARAAEMVNVEYIHLLIEQKWGITVPYNPALENPKVAANMEYLLGTVDFANKRLNGNATTDYLHSEYATQYAADTVATIDAADRLIKIEPKFWVTTTADTTEFEFTMSASGVFQIYWGDGTYDVIKRTDTTEETYSHTYPAPGTRTIGIGGNVMGYLGTNIGVDKRAAISFANNTNVAGISGSLGAVFHSLGDGNSNALQPKFISTFQNCSNLTGEIPAELFAGLAGKWTNRMFEATFSGCSGLTGSIPDNLFGDITGVPQDDMFNGTFTKCTGLTGKIPDNLFARVQGKPASAMFHSTFNGCKQLSGKIPENLFGGISGAPATNMFRETFSGCNNLTGSIPAGLFGDIIGTVQPFIFRLTFNGCSGLTGSIPAGLLGELSGPAAYQMFVGTFSGCSGLTGCIPDGLFGNITDMNLDEIIETYSPLYDTSVTQEYCSILGPKFFVTTTADYTIGIGGRATEYSTNNNTAAISFARN